jgi:hypothetical protein
MKKVRKWPWLMVFLCLVAAALGVTSVWRSESKDTQEVRQLMQSREALIREGLGSEVKFAKSGGSQRDAQETVDSIARFIAGRSDLVMSKGTNARLVAMEERALSGKAGLTTVENLTEALTDTLSARAAALSDKEITRAGETLRANHDVISLRADGEFSVTTEEFEAQARGFRDLAKADNSAVRVALHALVNREVDRRVTLLEAALPEHFGSARRAGVTPAQAVLITYSVISDDFLDGTQAELRRTVMGLPEVVNRKMVPGTKAEKAFGTKGRIFSTPINLVFNTKTMSSFLNRVEKGRDSK